MSLVTALMDVGIASFLFTPPECLHRWRRYHPIPCVASDAAEPQRLHVPPEATERWFARLLPMHMALR